MLVLTGTRLDQLCAESVLGAVAGATLPIACWAVLGFGGLRVPLILPLWSALTLGAAGAALPVFVLQVESVKRRRAARLVVGSFLDLVVLCLAGGMGIEGALHAAAQVGEDPVSRRLAATLSLARDSGHPPWQALASLGQELGVGELTELAAAVGLAGSEGARIRSTLAAKARSIRRHELAESEARANAVTQRLFMPGVLLLVGFLLFIGYPAVERITSGI